VLGKAERWPARTLDRVVRHYPRTTAVGGPNHVTLETAAAVDAKQIAEIGVYRGDTTCGLASIAGSDGWLHLFDFETTLVDVGERLRGIGFDRFTLYGASHRWLDSYNWGLMKMLEAHDEPILDYVFIDGAHTWAVDGFAFLLCDRLLKPGGHIDLDDIDWTLASSPSLSPDVFPATSIMYTDEQIQTRQVERIVDLLVRRDPQYDEIIPGKVFQKRRAA
jgi:predicted O-methyltransferase YrrM